MARLFKLTVLHMQCIDLNTSGRLNQPSAPTGMPHKVPKPDTRWRDATRNLNSVSPIGPDVLSGKPTWNWCQIVLANGISLNPEEPFCALKYALVLLKYINAK